MWFSRFKGGIDSIEKKSVIASCKQTVYAIRRFWHRPNFHFLATAKALMDCGKSQIDVYAPKVLILMSETVTRDRTKECVLNRPILIISWYTGDIIPINKQNGIRIFYIMHCVRPLWGRLRSGHYTTLDWMSVSHLVRHRFFRKFFKTLSIWIGGPYFTSVINFVSYFRFSIKYGMKLPRGCPLYSERVTHNWWFQEASFICSILSNAY